VLAEGIGSATSPGRLQVVGIEPTVIIDAAHNPDGALSAAKAIATYFTFDELAVVVGVLRDKDARGIVSALATVATRFYVTSSTSDRSVPADELQQIVLESANEESIWSFDVPADAIAEAREWAEAAPRRGVLITGSITLIGDALVIAEDEGWKR
jgi:dihydrofolate synthase/folylpolyglutamate synthase